MLERSGTTSSTAEDLVEKRSEEWYAGRPAGPHRSAPCISFLPALPAFAMLLGVLWLFAAVPAAAQDQELKMPWTSRR